MDGANVRAHQHATGAKRWEGDQALGRFRGGFRTKIHLKVEGRGKPVAFAWLRARGTRPQSLRS